MLKNKLFLICTLRPLILMICNKILLRFLAMLLPCKRRGHWFELFYFGVKIHQVIVVQGYYIFRVQYVYVECTQFIHVCICLVSKFNGSMQPLTNEAQHTLQEFECQANSASFSLYKKRQSVAKMCSPTILYTALMGVRKTHRAENITSHNYTRLGKYMCTKYM